MVRRTFLVVGCLALLAISSVAEAATGWTLTALNLRNGPGLRHAVIAAMPAGARVEVIHCESWCELYYAGRHGWASARYIGLGGYRPAPRVIIPPMPPAVYWEHRRPWWDDHHRSWYDGRRWWYDDHWHSHPRSGFYFEFNF